jgi:hypothetical protein
MANEILSPGIYINETDQSFIPEGITEVGAAIVGPTAKGPALVPTKVTSYADYVAKFGDLIESGGGSYSFLNNTAAYSYFNNGGSTLLVSRVVAGTYTSATEDVAATTNNAFTINTIAQGADQNSTSSVAANGALPSGSATNLRWSIINSNTGSGTFTLIVRRGDDDNNNLITLEQYTGLTLDPFDDNYIGKIIGTQRPVIQGSGEDLYVEIEGDYPNRSKYVYVTNINETPSYLDGDGNPRSQAFKDAMPVNNKNGSFKNGAGAIGAGALFGKDITGTNIQGVEASDYTASFYLLNDTQYKYTSIVAPGLNYSDNSTELDVLLDSAKERQDFLAVIDLGLYDATVDEVITTGASINNSYAAAYYPWLMSTDPATGRLTWSPASAQIPGVFAYNDRTSEPWFAPAGLSRGSLPTVLKTQRTLPKSSRDNLYSGKINPITAFPGAGVVVFGQKTLQSKASALDRINVRRLLINIKQFLDQQAGNIVFEPNSQATRNNFLAIVNPYLESVQQRQGLYAFKVVMDESINTAAVIDRNELVGQVYLQPTRTAEFVILNFNILPTGASFPENN